MLFGTQPLCCFSASTPGWLSITASTVSKAGVILLELPHMPHVLPLSELVTRYLCYYPLDQDSGICYFIGNFFSMYFHGASSFVSVLCSNISSKDRLSNIVLSLPFLFHFYCS